MNICQELNFQCEGYVLHYGQIVQNCSLRQVWDELKASCDFSKARERVDHYNLQNRWRKRGIAMIPTKFGISFTTKFMNQVTKKLQNTLLSAFLDHYLALINSFGVLSSSKIVQGHLSLSTKFFLINFGCLGWPCWWNNYLVTIINIFCEFVHTKQVHYPLSISILEFNILLHTTFLFLLSQIIYCIGWCSRTSVL